MNLRKNEAFGWTWKWKIISVLPFVLEPFLVAIFSDNIWTIVSKQSIEGGVKAVATGASMSFALLTDGSLLPWGSNGSGQLGDGTRAHRRSPARIMDDVVAISARDFYAVAITADGILWAKGVVAPSPQTTIGFDCHGVKKSC